MIAIEAHRSNLLWWRWIAPGSFYKRHLMSGLQARIIRKRGLEEFVKDFGMLVSNH
jgi:hypothetical protein